MHYRCKEAIGFGIGIAAGYVTSKELAIFSKVEACEKPSYPPQPHCTGAKCPMTRWDENWDMKENTPNVGQVRRIILVSRGEPESRSSLGIQNGTDMRSQTKPNGSNIGRNPAGDKCDSYEIFSPESTEDGSVKSTSSDDETDRGGLSPRGIRQIHSLANYLRSQFVNAVIRQHISAPDNASYSTRKIIEKYFSRPQRESMESRMLEEVQSLSDSSTLYESAMYRDLTRLEAAFRKIFCRPQPNHSSRWVEVIVCSPKTIAYMVCRLLQLPADRWTCWELPDGSFSEIAIHGDGFSFCRRVGDIGHLAAEDVSISS